MVQNKNASVGNSTQNVRKTGHRLPTYLSKAIRYSIDDLFKSQFDSLISIYKLVSIRNMYLSATSNQNDNNYFITKHALQHRLIKPLTLGLHVWCFIVWDKLGGNWTGKYRLKQTAIFVYYNYLANNRVFRVYYLYTLGTKYPLVHIST